VLLLEACEQWARELGQICLAGVRPIDPPAARVARGVVAHIHASLSGLTDSLEHRTRAILPDSPEADLGLGPTDVDQAQRAMRLLLRIDATLLRLARS
jgi:hypothetical protein